MSRHIDFVVRREKVRAALEYKILHDPAFAQYQQIDEHALSQLPLNGSVVERIPTCRSGRQADAVPDAVGPEQVAPYITVADGDGEEEEHNISIAGIPNLNCHIRPAGACYPPSTTSTTTACHGNNTWLYH